MSTEMTNQLVTIPGYLTRVDAEDGLECVVVVRDSAEILKAYKEQLADWIDEQIPNVRKVLYKPEGPAGAHTSIADLVVNGDGRRWLLESSGLRITTVGKALDTTGLLIEQHDKRVLIDGSPDAVDGVLDAWVVTQGFEGSRKHGELEAGEGPVHYGKGSSGGLTIIPHDKGAWFDITASNKSVVWAPGHSSPDLEDVDLVFGGWGTFEKRIANRSFYPIGLSRATRIDLAKSDKPLAVPGTVFMPMTDGMVEVRKFGEQLVNPEANPNVEGGPNWDPDDPEIDLRSATKVQLESAVDCGTCENFTANPDKDGIVGTCDIVKGVVQAGQVCNFWSSIVSGFVSKDLSYSVSKAVGAKQYTFGVVYKATDNKKDSLELDAHDEFVTADVLQEGQWNYVKNGSREIHLQHDMMGMIQVGEWVDIVAWPDKVEMDLTLPNGDTKKATIPENSIWMGVLWNDIGWRMVKSGQIRGLSMGGMAKRRHVRARTK